MLTPKAKYEDILSTLEQVVEFAKLPILTSELQTIARRLVEFHGIELFRILRDLPARRFFPSGAEIEREVRAVLGKPAPKGLTEELIEKNERECVVSGQSPEKARQGAEVARKTLRAAAIPQVDSQKLTQEDVANAVPGSFVYEMREKMNELLLSAVIPQAVAPEYDPLEALKDFGGPGQDPLDALESFD